MKQKTHFKAPPLKNNNLDKMKLPEMTKEQMAILLPFGQIQQEIMSIDMLSTQYSFASFNQDVQKRKKCADLMVERARILLEAAEELARADKSRV